MHNRSTAATHVVPDKILAATYVCCYRDLFIGMQFTFIVSDHHSHGCFPVRPLGQCTDVSGKRAPDDRGVDGETLTMHQPSARFISVYVLAHLMRFFRLFYYRSVFPTCEAEFRTLGAPAWKTLSFSIALFYNNNTLWGGGII